MRIISVLHLKEIHPGEGCFFFVQSYCFKLVQRRKNMFSEVHISKTTWPIFLKFGMPSRVYGGYKICKFNRNRSSSYRDMRCWNGDLTVPVNNTLVCNMSFLAADTQLCVLIPLWKSFHTVKFKLKDTVWKTFQGTSVGELDERHGPEIGPNVSEMPLESSGLV